MSDNEQSLTRERLHEVLAYEAETGLFRWRVRTSNRVKIGDVAGSLRKDGYVEIRIDGALYLAHRLVFFYCIGVWPGELIDHRDLNRSNNRWGNLRDATHSQNHANQELIASNTSGFKGVSWSGRKKRWRAQIKVNRKNRHLGYFGTAEDASAAYKAAAIEHFGEFARAA